MVPHQWLRRSWISAGWGNRRYLIPYPGSGSAKVPEVVCLGFLNFIFETQQARNFGRDVFGIAFI